jgi:hypothetical protein
MGRIYELMLNAFAQKSQCTGTLALTFRWPIHAGEVITADAVIIGRGRGAMPPSSTWKSRPSTSTVRP